MKTQDLAVKNNSKRNSKSFNDQNRSFDGKLKRRAACAFKQRRQSINELFAAV